MSKIEQLEKLEGNTSSSNFPMKKQVNQSKYWCFTLNNYLEQDLHILTECFKNNDIKYIIGEEVGQQGTPHLQGYIETKTKIRPSELKLNKKIHWESRKGTEEQNIKYCSKDNKYVCNGFKVKKPLKILKDEQLYEFQKSIIDLVKTEPDDRHIYWYYDLQGNIGKTQTAKYLSFHYNAVPLDGKLNDILYCAAVFESEIYIYNIPRTKKKYLSYESVEKIKDGYFMCSKYESKPIIRNSPHILIFANFLPDVHKLSIDRWKIYNIHDKKCVHIPTDSI